MASLNKLSFGLVFLTVSASALGARCLANEGAAAEVQENRGSQFRFGSSRLQYVEVSKGAVPGYETPVSLRLRDAGAQESQKGHVGYLVRFESPVFSSYSGDDLPVVNKEESESLDDCKAPESGTSYFLSPSELKKELEVLAKSKNLTLSIGSTAKRLGGAIDYAEPYFEPLSAALGDIQIVNDRGDGISLLDFVRLNLQFSAVVAAEKSISQESARLSKALPNIPRTKPENATIIAGATRRLEELKSTSTVLAAWHKQTEERLGLFVPVSLP